MWLVPGEIMPPLYRSLGGVIRRLTQELMEIAKREKLDPKDVANDTDVSADYVGFDQGIKLEVAYRGRKVWERTFLINRSKMEDMTDEAFDKSITTTMRQQLSLSAQMHWARLDKLFPDRIGNVTTEYNTQLAVKIIKVFFKNGHTAEAPEQEAKSDLFTARCAMIYDLPPI